MHVLSLRDDLFLLAHDDSGKLLASEASIGAGLAGAVLIDLLLSRRVAVVDGRLTVLELAVTAADGAAATADEEATATMDAIAANTAPCGPRAWVSWISHGAYGRAAEALSAAGVVQRFTARRLGFVPVSRCLPENPDDLVRVRAKVRYAIHARDLPDPYTAALCGLIRVLRLESSLLLNMATSDLLLALERMTSADEVTVRQVTNAVDAVITTATYR
jgi:Golgi phosphoprotein 3 GPP34